MPNMHVSVFIRLKDSIEASSLIHTETNSFSVTVKVACGSERGEVAIFADSLSQLADFGRAILEQCDKLAGGPATESAPDPFLPNAQLEAMTAVVDPDAWVSTQEPAMVEALNRIVDDNKHAKNIPF